MNKLTLATFAVFMGLATAMTSMPSLVMADDIVIEEIVVTARQRSELIEDVPVSITAFTELDIKSAGIRRAEDFINLTPGVSIVDAAEVGDTQVSIRGINGTRDGESNFAFIIDGILMTNPSAFNREFSDLQQIEVLKGPQGALYGRSAAAGAIIVTTKKPGNEFETDFTFSGANHSSGFASGMASGALIQDKLFGRFSFDYRTTDGFYHNNFLDTDSVDDFEGFNLNGRLLWEPSDRTSVDTRFRYGEVDAAAITFNASFALPLATGGVSGPQTTFEDVNTHPFVFQGNVDPQNDQESKEFSIKIDHDMDWATAAGWFLYSDIQQEFISDGTSASFGIFVLEQDCIDSTEALFLAGVTLPGPTFLGLTPDFPTSFFGAYTPTTCDGYQFQVRNQEDFSVDFRLTSPDEDRLRWQAGLYYLHLEREVGVGTGIDNTFSGVTLPDQLFVAGVTENLLWDDFTTNVYAVYGSLAYDVTPDIEASFALRYDLEDREVESLVPVNATTTFILGGGVPLNPGITLGVAVPDRDESFDQLQPKLSLTWDATDNLTLFTTWGVGFKSGGFNNTGSAATVDFWFNTLLAAEPGFVPITISDKFEKEVSQSVEVGFKARYGRVKLDGAIYHTEVDDMQFFEFFVGPFGLLRVVNSIDEVSINGGELALSVDANDYLTFFASMSVVNGRIDTNVSRPNTVGNEVPYAPDRTANLGLNFYIPIKNNIDFTARFDWNYVGDTWFHTIQDEVVPGLFSLGGFGPTDLSIHKRDSYQLMNLRAGLQGDNWSLIGFAYNLADKDYLEEVIPAPEFGGSFIHPGNTRTLGLELNLQF